MAEYFDVEFEDYIIFHRGIRNFYITDENDENPLHLHVVYQDGKDIDMGNPYGNYVAEAKEARSTAVDSADAAKRWAIGRKLDDLPVSATDETYENNSKYYSERTKENAEQTEEYAYGTRNGVAVPGKEEDNVKYYYQAIKSVVTMWDDLGSSVHYTGICSSSANESNKIVVLKDGEDNTISNVVFKNGTHLSVEFMYDNSANGAYLTIGSQEFLIMFPEGAVNYDKLCGTCEFAVKKINNEYVCTFLSSNKYEPVIYATGELPAAGKLGQLCVVKKESD